MLTQGMAQDNDATTAVAGLVNLRMGAAEIDRVPCSDGEPQAVCEHDEAIGVAVERKHSESV
jgi:hypothetical protein